MVQPLVERIRWRDNPNAVELGFDHYLTLIEGRLRGEEVSLVQGLRRFYREELSIDLRETQARGLMHRSSSVFIEYVNSILDSKFLPNFEYWESRGLDQFLQWKKEFYQARNIEAVDVQIADADAEVQVKAEGSLEPPGRREVVVRRVIRDYPLSRFLKTLYQHRCQICKYTFTFTSLRRYAETHHIRPLGRPHDGIDKETNMIVLCPNHHAMMDFGALAIHPDRLTLMSSDSASSENGLPLLLISHSIDREFLEYHVDNIFGKV